MNPHLFDGMWRWRLVCLLSSPYIFICPANAQEFLETSLAPPAELRDIVSPGVAAARALRPILQPESSPNSGLAVLIAARHAYALRVRMPQRFLLQGTPPSVLTEDPRFVANALGLLTEATNEDATVPLSVRIIGGQRAGAEAADVVAILPIPGTPGSRDKICSGVLISSKTVLTAAHCVADGIAGVVQFGVDIRSNSVTAEAVVQSAVSDPLWSASLHDSPHDFALLLLDRPARAFGARPRPIAGAGAFQRWLASSPKMVIAAGYGWTCATDICDTKERRYTNVPIASPTCEGTVNGQTDHDRYGCSYGAELVAEDPEFKSDTCLGDSGGPIYIRDPVNHIDYSAGVVSRAHDQAPVCGMGTIYGLLTDTVVTWIHSVLDPKGETLKVVN